MGLNSYLQSTDSLAVRTEALKKEDYFKLQSGGAAANPNPRALAGTLPNYLGSIINDLHIRNLAVAKLLAGTITVALNLGTSSAGSVILDGANNRILINDGTVNRISIGNV